MGTVTFYWDKWAMTGEKGYNFGSYKVSKRQQANVALNKCIVIFLLCILIVLSKTNKGYTGCTKKMSLLQAIRLKKGHFFCTPFSKAESLWEIRVCSQYISRFVKLFQKTCNKKTNDKKIFRDFITSI